MTVVKGHNETKVNAAQINGLKLSKLSLQEQVALLLLKKSSGSLQETAKLVLDSPTDVIFQHSNRPANALLAALFAEIECNAAISKAQGAAVKSVLNYVNSQIDVLEKLKEQMQALEKQMKGNLSPAQIQAIEAKIQTLELEYENAIAAEQAAQKDISNRGEENKQLEKENQELEKEAKDPAKRAEAEKKIQANDQKIASNKSQMKQDNIKIKAAKAVIYSAISGMNALATQYPAISNQLAAITSEMKDAQSITSSCSALTKGLQKIAHEDAALASQIANIASQINIIQNTLVDHISKTDLVIKDLQKAGSWGAKERELFKSIKNLVLEISQLKFIERFNGQQLKLKSTISRDYNAQLIAKRRGLI